MTLDPELLGAVVQNAPDGIIVVDAEGRIVFANQRMQTLLGHTPSALLGQPIETLVPGRFRALHVRHRAAYHDQPSARPMGTGLRLSALRADGTDLPVEISLSPMPGADGLVTAIIRDVSEREALQSARRRAEEQYRLLAEHARDIIYSVRLVPPPAAIQYISPASSPLTGYAPEEYYADPELFVRITHAADRPLLDRLFADPDSGPNPFLVRVHRRDGAIVWLEHQFTVIRDSDGRPVGIEGIVRDTTQRVAEEEERQRLRAESELQEDRERIARDLHDGVMQAIYGVGLTLVDAQSRARSAPDDASARIDEAVGALRTVISDIRQYVMALPLERLDVDLRASLARLVADAMERSALAATFEAPDTLPDLSIAERETVFNVAREALTNAERHAQATRADVRMTTTPDALTLEVRDNGRGFDPRRALSDDHMGLRNMRTRAAQVDALLTVDSAPGRGTTVALRVPLRHTLGSG